MNHISQLFPGYLAQKHQQASVETKPQWEKLMNTPSHAHTPLRHEEQVKDEEISIHEFTPPQNAILAEVAPIT